MQGQASLDYKYWTRMVVAGCDKHASL